jgi:hypothetical protein
MGEFRFEPIKVSASAPGGERLVRTFDDIAAFIADALDTPRRQSTRWQAAGKRGPSPFWRKARGGPPGHARRAGGRRMAGRLAAGEEARCLRAPQDCGGFSPF